jgi:hypothetical protein
MNVLPFNLCGRNDEEKNSQRPCPSTGQSPSRHIHPVDAVAIVIVDNIIVTISIIYFLHVGLALHLHLG